MVRPSTSGKRNPADPPLNNTTTTKLLTLATRGVSQLATLTTPQLNRRFIEALGDAVVDVDDPDASILTLQCDPPLPDRLRVYLYNATNPPGGRPTPEHKIQLMVPGQRRDQRGNFDFSDGYQVLLVGYTDEYDAFILWDANLHRDFAFSKNAQVRTETVETARRDNVVSTQQRNLSLGQEIVIAAPSNLLAEAINLRTTGTAATAVVPSPPEALPQAVGSVGGREYVPPRRRERSEEQSENLVFEVDPNIIDRGTTAHKDTQDALAATIRSHDLEPLSPAEGDPEFDVAWINDEVAYIAEVKSLTRFNETRQLRLGLGQVLSYVHVINWPDVRAARAVLAVEHAPNEDYWVTLCAEYDVILTWPETFDELF